MRIDKRENLQEREKSSNYGLLQNNNNNKKRKRKRVGRYAKFNLTDKLAEILTYILEVFVIISKSLYIQTYRKKLFLYYYLHMFDLN